MQPVARKRAESTDGCIANHIEGCGKGCCLLRSNRVTVHPGCACGPIPLPLEIDRGLPLGPIAPGRYPMMEPAHAFALRLPIDPKQSFFDVGRPPRIVFRNQAHEVASDRRARSELLGGGARFR